MDIEEVKQIETQNDARQFAIDWQYWQSDVSMSWQEANDWGFAFGQLAEEFDLIEEFTENGII